MIQFLMIEVPDPTEPITEGIKQAPSILRSLVFLFNEIDLLRFCILCGTVLGSFALLAFGRRRRT